MRKIAIPVENHLLSEHFGHADEFAIFETEDLEILSQSMEEAPDHEEGSYPDWLIDKEVTHVIASRIGRKAIKALEEANINIFRCAQVADPETIVRKFLNGSLERAAGDCE